MAEKKLSNDEWDELVRGFFKEITRSATRGRGGSQALANAVGLTKQSVSDLRAGRIIGSVVSNMRILFYKAGLSDHEAKKLLQNPNIAIKSIDSPSIVDGLVEELKNLYSENELAAWMKLLISKRKVEDDLGISMKVSVKKSQTKKTS